MKKSNSNSKTVDSCNVNFGKVKDRSVKVYLGDKKHDGVEIIGSRGKYAINADSSNESLAKLRGKSGNLKEVKRAVASHLCEMQSSAKATSSEQVKSIPIDPLSAADTPDSTLPKEAS